MEEPVRWYNRVMPGRERVYRTEAVVLRRQDFGEADRLLTVYSLERGKLRLIAKGVRKPKSRKAGHLEPFTRVRLMNAQGRELDVVTQAEAIEMYPEIQQDLNVIGCASYIAELVDRFTVEREDNRRIFFVLTQALERLASGYRPATVRRVFELSLLETAGYRPELFHCLDCGAEIRPEAQFFSISGGGVVCTDCGGKTGGLKPISLPALKVLRHFQRSTFSEVTGVEIRDEVHRELDQLAEGFVSHILERKLNSPDFIHHLEDLPSRMADPEA
jgi:DNA repair protein RecO (recombination protein O)